MLCIAVTNDVRITCSRRLAACRGTGYRGNDPTDRASSREGSRSNDCGTVLPNNRPDMGRVQIDGRRRPVHDTSRGRIHWRHE